MRKILLLATMIITIISCNNEEKAVESIYWVNSYKVDCEGVAPMSCMQVIKADDYHNLEWQNFYDNIEGFNFEPGYLYQLVVSEQKIEEENVKADKSNVKYKLIRVLMKKPDDKLKINDIWVLESFASEEINLAEGQPLPQIEFNLAKNSYNGNDGCNSFFGTIASLDESKLSLSPGGSTMKMCNDTSLSDEFNKKLIKAAYYETKDLNLILKDSNGQELMVFRKVD